MNRPPYSEEAGHDSLFCVLNWGDFSRYVVKNYSLCHHDICSYLYRKNSTCFPRCAQS